MMTDLKNQSPVARILTQAPQVVAAETGQQPFPYLDTALPQAILSMCGYAI